MAQWIWPLAGWAVPPDHTPWFSSRRPAWFQPSMTHPFKCAVYARAFGNLPRNAILVLEIPTFYRRSTIPALYAVESKYPMQIVNLVHHLNFIMMPVVLVKIVQQICVQPPPILLLHPSTLVALLVVHLVVLLFSVFAFYFIVVVHCFSCSFYFLLFL